MNPPSANPPHVYWLFGLSGAGKSTLAERLRSALVQNGQPVLSLDGDTVRGGLCAGLGYSEADRSENLRRSAEVARLAVGSGLNVVASFITPLERHREMVRDIVGRDRVSFVFLDAPLATCQARDVKGLYRRAAQGELPQMTGLGSRFERPSDADLVLDTASHSVAGCADMLWDFAKGRLREG